jgi:hypothetical protein
MEAALADAGARRSVGETPAELLRRARREGLVADPPATTLLDLFTEARFSRHHMRTEHRVAAEQALEALRRELREVGS